MVVTLIFQTNQQSMKKVLICIMCVFFALVIYTCEEENKRPTCNIITPSNNATFYKGDIIIISVEATDPDGTILEIQLVIDDIGITSLQTFPYNYEWITASETEGSHEIEVTAIDNKGGKNSSIIHVTIESSLPVVTTSNITDISYTSAQGGGVITNHGSYPITTRGLVWDTNQNPTIESNYGYISSGSGTGSFTGSLIGLTQNTTYYVRAYATNNEGTAYGNEKDFTTLQQYGTFIDNRDNKTYKWMIIGNQTWMAENLNIGNVIDGSEEQTDNGIIEKYAVNNSSEYCDSFGGLYQWHEMMDYATTESAQGVCPDGWYIPTDTEWKELEMYLGMSQAEADGYALRGSTEGGKLKEIGTTYWTSPNTAATNEVGFTALAGGYRDYNGKMGNVKNDCVFWSSTEDADTTGWYRYLHYDSGGIWRYSNSKNYGFSVRCIKDQ